MAKYNLAVGRPLARGWERAEVSNMMVEVTMEANCNPEIAPHIENVFNIPISRCPTDAARNFLVKTCQERRVDFLLMIDEDCAAAPGLFKSMFLFLLKQPEPSVVVSPYCSGDGFVQVKYFVTDQAVKNHLDSWKLQNISREESARKTGFERVASGGTHCLLIDMRVFSKLKKPYFRYLYDENHEEVLETEDCWFFRMCHHAQIPVYCDWDYFSGHWKEQLINRPNLLGIEEIPNYYLRHALAYKKEEIEAQIAATPPTETAVTGLSGVPKLSKLNT